MNKFTLNKIDQKKWQKNLIVFLAPVGVMYLTTFIGLISQEAHMFSFHDFVPTTFTLGGITLYFANAALDYLKKLEA